MPAVPHCGTFAGATDDLSRTCLRGLGCVVPFLCRPPDARFAGRPRGGFPAFGVAVMTFADRDFIVDCARRCERQLALESTYVRVWDWESAAVCADHAEAESSLAFAAARSFVA